MLQVTSLDLHPQTNATGEADRTARIRALNDAFRRCPEAGLGITGRLLFTSGIAALGADKWAILARVKTYSDFDGGNDPWGEHDFGAFDFKGETIFWKIDTYDRTCESASPDPTDPAVTCRVLTILLASEY